MIMFMLIIMTVFVYRLNFRLTCVLGFGSMCTFYVLTFSYPFMPGRLIMFNESSECTGCR